MKAILGGRDAQSVESAKTTYPDFKIASNGFKIIEGLVLELGRGRNLPSFYICGVESIICIRLSVKTHVY